MGLMNDSPPKLREDLYTRCQEDLDTVGWRHGISFEAYGVKLGIRSEDSGVLSQLVSQIPFGCELCDAKIVDRIYSVLRVHQGNHQETRYNLYLNHEIFSLNLTTQELLERLQAFCSVAIAELSTQHLFVHAGVVGWQGGAILIPGKSQAGKSTLVAELIKRGATYYSDEFALIDDDGYVSNFPKPLSLRKPYVNRQRDIPVEEIGGIVGERRLPVSQVILTEYKSKSIWQPDRLTPGQGVLFMLEHTPSTQGSPAKAINILSRAISGASVLKSYRGDAAKASAAILDIEESHYVE